MKDEKIKRLETILLEIRFELSKDACWHNNEISKMMNNYFQGRPDHRIDFAISTARFKEYEESKTKDELNIKVETEKTQLFDDLSVEKKVEKLKELTIPELEGILIRKELIKKILNTSYR